MSYQNNINKLINKQTNNIMKNSNHNWNHEDLVIAYYYAKWGTSGIGTDEETLAVLIDTTKASLIKQAANFRGYLGIEGFKLENPTGPGKKKCEICEELKDKTITQVREMVKAIIADRQHLVTKKQNSDNNKIANAKRDELNAQAKLNFENKMKLYRAMGKNLRQVTK